MRTLIMFRMLVPTLLLHKRAETSDKHHIISNLKIWTQWRLGPNKISTTQIRTVTPWWKTKLLPQGEDLRFPMKWPTTRQPCVNKNKTSLMTSVNSCRKRTQIQWASLETRPSKVFTIRWLKIRMLQDSHWFRQLREQTTRAICNPQASLSLALTQTASNKTCRSKTTTSTTRQFTSKTDSAR